MKNLTVSIVLAFFSVSLFCCEQPNDPQPEPTTGMRTMAGYEAAPVSNVAGMQVTNTTPDRPPVSFKFEWKLMKTATVPYNKGLNLSAPFAIVDENAGDISWGSDGGCYQAIRSWKVTRAILKIVDVKTITPAYLKTLTFTTGMVAHAPAGSYSWTDYMPIGTVIAYKTSTGANRLVVVKSVFPLILDIYHEHYYTVY